MIRRSRFLISFWEDGKLRVLNYATGEGCLISPSALAILDRLDDWTAPETLVQRLESRESESIQDLVDDLVEKTLVETISRAPHPAETAMESWRGWNPAAGFFHQATRDVEYREPPSGGRPRPLFTDRPNPGLVKSYPDAETILLPSFLRDGPLPRVLLERRTWRRFGRLPIPLQEMSTVLGLTFAVQRWLHLGDGGRVALKTSPSGGAKHSLEAYLLAWNIDGLDSGTYHYCPDTHSLAVIESPTTRACLEHLLPAQEWFHRPAALVIMTSVFERVQARYDFPRAYRVLLIEAGHFCQTFCLLATSMGLAPFCTAAFNDSAVERHLGIDGIGEAAIYAAGLGSRPEDYTSALPFPGEKEPVTSLPSWASRTSDLEQEE